MPPPEFHSYPPLLANGGRTAPPDALHGSQNGSALAWTPATGENSRSAPGSQTGLVEAQMSACRSIARVLWGKSTPARTTFFRAWAFE
jgi:hypothetical protein